MREQTFAEYFYGNDSGQFVFFRIPRQLIVDAAYRRISTEAKLLYGMLLDRMGLSVKNGWYDAQGRVYIYYTVNEICADLNCGRDKAMKLLAELDGDKGIGLIERVRQGQGKPARIYVKRFIARSASADPPAPTSEVDFPDVQKSEKPTPKGREARRQAVENSDANHIDVSKTENNQTNPSISKGGAADIAADRRELRDEIKRAIDYGYLCSHYPFDDVESLLELMAEVESSSAAVIRVGGELLPTETVRRRFLQLDRSHLEYVIESLRQTGSKIVNIRAYLLTALYNAPVTMGPYYSAVARHDTSRE